MSLEPFVGASGLLLAHNLSLSGSDDQDHIIHTAVTDKGQTLYAETAARLFDLPVASMKEQAFSAPDPVKSVVEAQRQSIRDDMAARKAKWFDEERMDKLDNWADDKRTGMKADLKDFDDEIKLFKKRSAPDRKFAGQADAPE